MYILSGTAPIKSLFVWMSRKMVCALFFVEIGRGDD